MKDPEIDKHGEFWPRVWRQGADWSDNRLKQGRKNGIKGDLRDSCVGESKLRDRIIKRENRFRRQQAELDNGLTQNLKCRQMERSFMTL